MAFLPYHSQTELRIRRPSLSLNRNSSLLLFEALLFEEGGIEIGAVNLNVAQRAGLEEAGLVVERRHARCAAKAGRGVALQTEQVHAAELQHVGIWSAVRQMARLAAFNLDGRMLEHERPLLVGVALEADRV